MYIHVCTCISKSEFSTAHSYELVSKECWSQNQSLNKQYTCTRLLCGAVYNRTKLISSEFNNVELQKQ